VLLEGEEEAEILPGWSIGSKKGVLVARELEGEERKMVAFQGERARVQVEEREKSRIGSTTCP